MKSWAKPSGLEGKISEGRRTAEGAIRELNPDEIAQAAGGAKTHPTRCEDTFTSSENCRKSDKCILW